MWNFFWIGQNRSSNQKVRYDFRSPIPKFRHTHALRSPSHARQSFHFKKFQGAQILIFFFMKIGMELLFTLKNKHRNTNLKFDFLKVQHFGTPKSAFLVQKNVFFVFRLWFSFENNRRTNVLLVSIFENTQKKLLTVKNAILAVFGG